MPDFKPIRPGERDFFTFDFTARAGTATIASTPTWTCDLSPESPVDDPTPDQRIIGGATFSGAVTTQLVGDMVDGATYVLSTSITLTDGRVLTQSGIVECALAPVDPSVITVEAIRQDFPALADPTLYTDESIQFWIDSVINLDMLNADRWGEWLPLGQKLWVAHQSVIDAQLARNARRGGLALTTGVPTSRSVGGVSVSYDTSLGQEMNAGYFALTPYGNRYYQLARIVGAGPVQV